ILQLQRSTQSLPSNFSGLCRRKRRALPPRRTFGQPANRFEPRASDRHRHEDGVGCCRSRRRYSRTLKPLFASQLRRDVGLPRIIRFWRGPPPRFPEAKARRNPLCFACLNYPATASIFLPSVPEKNAPRFSSRLTVDAQPPSIARF